MASDTRSAARPVTRSPRPARHPRSRRRSLPRVRATGRRTPESVALAVVTASLLGLGLLMTFSASFVTSTAESGDPFRIAQRQALWSAVGVPLLLLGAAVDYRRWRRLAGFLFFSSLLATAVVLVPGIGVEVNGARRWIDFGPVRFQPTELLKLSLPLYVAHLLARRWDVIRRGDLAALLLPALPLIAVAAVLVALEPDLETALLIAAVGGFVLYTAGLPGRLISLVGGGAIVFGAIAIAVTPFRRGRLAAWLDPMAYADTFGYQTVQGLIALGSGGWFGAGVGQGRGKWLYIPNAHTDFIFAIIGEELGLVGALTVVALFAALAVVGVRVARLAPDVFGRLLAGALTSWLILQAGINIGSVVGLLPVTGVTLPLVSFGGSSLVFTMLGLGLLLSVARHACTPTGRGRRR